MAKSIVTNKYRISQKHILVLQVPVINYPANKVPLLTAKKCLTQRQIMHLPVVAGAIDLEKILQLLQQQPFCK